MTEQEMINAKDRLSKLKRLHTKEDHTLKFYRKTYAARVINCEELKGGTLYNILKKNLAEMLYKIGKQEIVVKSLNEHIAYWKDKMNSK